MLRKPYLELAVKSLIHNTLAAGGLANHVANNLKHDRWFRDHIARPTTILLPEIGPEYSALPNDRPPNLYETQRGYGKANDPRVGWVIIESFVLLAYFQLALLTSSPVR